MARTGSISIGRMAFRYGGGRGLIAITAAQAESTQRRGVFERGAVCGDP
jgi:hypothetical protein